MNEIYSRRSVRQYRTDPVPREKLIEVIQAGTCAPSALNNMHRQFTAITNREIIDLLNRAVEDALDQDSKTRIKSRLNGKFSFFYNAPALIVVSTDPDSFCPDADCAVGLENIFLEAERLGLSTCWINQLNVLCSNGKVREVLTKAGIPSHHMVYGSCAIGYSDAEKKTVTSKPNKIVICD